MSFSTQLYSFQQNVFKIGGPILMTIGSISCLLNLLVFTKGNLRKNPCTICFIVVNVINFIYFYLGLLLTFLAVGYNIDPSTSNIAFCRFRYYIANVLGCWQSSSLILASIDRTLITSPNAGTRKLSTPRFITVILVNVGLFWIVLHIHALIFTEILEFGPGYFVCYYQPGTYTTIMGYYSLVITGILPPLLLAIFGFWTVKNIRGIRRLRNATAETTGVGRIYALKSKDKQLIRMLLVDIFAFIICKGPAGFFPIYNQITQYNEKSADQQVIEQSVLQLTFFWYFVDHCIGFFTNMLVSKTFRIEFKQICSNMYHFCTRHLN